MPHDAPVSSRLIDIDRAKGLAILLVVFGHVVAREPPSGNQWYPAAKEAVYAFHMAFFMFLSGVVFFLRARPVADYRAFAAAVRKRFMRLMPAYFLFAGIVFAGKWGAQHFAHVDNPVTGWGGLLDIVLFPMQSASAFLWYVYVLFIFSAVGLALLSLTRGRILPLLALGVLLQFVPYVQFLGLGQCSKFFLFFALGGAAVAAWDSYTRWVDRLWLPALIALIWMLVAGWHMHHLDLPIAQSLGQAAPEPALHEPLATWSLPYGWIFAGLLSIPALHGLCRREFAGEGMLQFVGSMTFPIYLMNTMAIGATKAVLLKFTSWDGLNFDLLFFPALMAAGVLLPIALKRYLFPRVAWLDRITS